MLYIYIYITATKSSKRHSKWHLSHEHGRSWLKRFLNVFKRYLLSSNLFLLHLHWGKKYVSTRWEHEMKLSGIICFNLKYFGASLGIIARSIRLMLRCWGDVWALQLFKPAWPSIERSVFFESISFFRVQKSRILLLRQASSLCSNAHSHTRTSHTYAA